MGEIDIIREVKKFIKEARTEAKLSNCLYCGKQVTSFCNSHTVPKFVLRNLAKNGMLGIHNTIIELPVLETEVGLGKAGVFRVICNQCDNYVFQDYENETTMLSIPTNKMLAAISLKNQIRIAAKRINEIKLYEKAAEKCGDNFFLRRQIEGSKLDYDECLREINYSKNILKNDLKSGFKLLFWKKMDYKIPIATQNSIFLPGDLEGKRLNNKFDFSPENILQGLEIAVFPLKQESVIILFAKTEHTLITKRFLKQLNRKSEDEILEIINFIIFKYTEDYYLNPDTANFINEVPSIKMIATSVPEIPGSFDEFKKEEQELLHIKDYEIPNLLSEKYKLN